MLSIFITITLLVSVFLIAPLLKFSKEEILIEDENTTELAVYRKQLNEIKFEEELDLIGNSEAELAKAEVARRIIKASELTAKSKNKKTNIKHNIFAAIIILLVIPSSIFLVYMEIGRPDLHDKPFRSRDKNLDMMRLVKAAIIELQNNINENPEELIPRQQLAELYIKAGSVNKAINTLKPVILINNNLNKKVDDNVVLKYGTLLIHNNQGKINNEIEILFNKLYERNPKLSEAQFMLGYIAYQKGDNDKALRLWEQLKSTANHNEIWYKDLSKYIENARKKLSIKNNIKEDK